MGRGHALPGKGRGNRQYAHMGLNPSHRMLVVWFQANTSLSLSFPTLKMGIRIHSWAIGKVKREAY